MQAEEYSRDLWENGNDNRTMLLGVLGKEGGLFVSEDTDVYDTVEWDTYDAVIRGTDGEEHYRQEGVEFPKSWTQQAVNIVSSKYFYTWPEDSFHSINGRETSLKQLLDRIVGAITTTGLSEGYFLDKKEATLFCKNLKYMMLHQMFAFNSPVWFNIGTPEMQQASACFINDVQDNMDSIMDLAHDEANIFKMGSGAGVNLSNIRSRGEFLTGGGEASGPVSFMKGYDSFAGVIKSGGKKRRAAKMIILNDNHPDVEEFIWCKAKEEKKAFDLIEAGYDPSFDAEDGAYGSVFFQNANHSVRITDDFMGTVESKEEWDLVNVTDSSVSKTLDAEELLQEISKAAWECGDPGLQFHDTINKWHTAKASGDQEASNPCSEYMFLNNTACNLGSFNLVKFLYHFKGEKEQLNFDVEKFKTAVEIATIAQDILVTHAEYPNDKIDEGTRKWRTLGLGYANLGAMLMRLGLPYDSEPARRIAGFITSIMSGTAYGKSSKIAKKLGPFEGIWEEKDGVSNITYMNQVINKHLIAAEKLKSNSDKYVENSEYFNENLHGSIYRTLKKEASGPWYHGKGDNLYRNAQISVLAPTGTISFAMDCDTTGVEPGISLVSYKKLVGGGTFKIVNDSVKHGLDYLGYTGQEKSEILDCIEETDTIEGAPHISEKDLKVFDCAFSPHSGTRSISWKGHIDMMAITQPFISGAISKTVNLPEDATVQDIRDAYFYAWKVGLKAIAVYRNGCKQSQPLSTKDEEAPVDTPSVEEYAARESLRRKLPDTRRSITHKFRIGEQKGYLTVGLYKDGTPGELFITMNKEGSTISGLMDAFATAISVGLQYGAPLEDMVSKFKYSQFEPSGFTSNPDIRVAKSIVDYIFKWMEHTFCEEPEDAKRKELEDYTPIQVEKEQNNKYTAPLCSVCGNLTVRSGACYACPVCGETTGCG